jgi:lipopolysaccharide heptosyltransferase I
MASLNRILIIKLGSIGDVVHTLPALAALKKSYPEAAIDWLVEKKSSIILQKNPLIRQIIEVDTQRWRKSLLSFEVFRQIKTSLSRMRDNRYDVALDFQGLWKSAAFGYFSGAKQVVGFDKEALREPGCRIFYDNKISPSADAVHVIEIYNELARSLGAETNGYRFDLNVSEEDDAYIASQLASRHMTDFIILNPGGGWATKNWDPTNYSRLHLRIRKKTGWPSIITWGPGDEALVEQVFRDCGTDPPVAFPTTIPQFVSLVRRAKLFVGGDTGPLHLAAACQTPVVGIFGPTHPSRNGPFRQADLVVSHPVPCGPCYKRTCEIYDRQCMRLVTVDDVYQAVIQRLGLP